MLASPAAPPPPPSSEVLALLALYQGMGGERWVNATGWGQGNPCTDGWQGVTCCKASHPFYRFSDHGFGSCYSTCDNDADVSGPLSPSRGVTDREGRDAVVVAIELSGMQLECCPDEFCEGSCVPEDILGLSRLAKFDISNNSLSGPFPGWLYDSSWGDRGNSSSPACGAPIAFLGRNDFEYDQAELFQALQVCRAAGNRFFNRCGTGLPPVSCDAFGSDYRVKLDDANRCVDCREVDLVGPFVVLLVLLVIFALLLACYLSFLKKYEERLDLAINTAAILVCHVQILQIFGTLALARPPSVNAITDLAAFATVSPECVTGGSTGHFGPVMTLISMALLVTPPVLLSLLQWLVRASLLVSPDTVRDRVTVSRKPSAEKQIDQFEKAKTVVIALSFSSSWSIVGLLWIDVSLDKNANVYTLNSTWVVGAMMLSLVLVAMFAFLLCKYFRQIRAVMTGRSGACSAKQLTPERMATRLSFLMERFGEHAPYWQFCIVRQRLARARATRTWELERLSPPPHARTHASTRTPPDTAVRSSVCSSCAQWARQFLLTVPSLVFEMTGRTQFSTRHDLAEDRHVHIFAQIQVHTCNDRPPPPPHLPAPSLAQPHRRLRVRALRVRAGRRCNRRPRLLLVPPGACAAVPLRLPESDRVGSLRGERCLCRAQHDLHGGRVLARCQSQY